MSTPLEQAVTYIKAGNVEKGRQLLIEILGKNPRDENAWLWMSKCVADIDQKRECFQRVLQINPNNQFAQDGLRRLDGVKIRKPEVSSTKPFFIIGTILVIGVAACFCAVFLGLVYMASNSQSTSAPVSTPAHPLPTVRPSPTVNPEVEKANWGTVDIRALIKNPDNYLAHELHYRGEVFNISEDSSGAVMQVWVNIPGGNEYEREAVIVYWSGTTENIYEGTTIEFWGYGVGSYEGTNGFGAAIQQPIISAKYLIYFYP